MLDLQRGQKISIQTVCRTWTLEVELRHQGPLAVDVSCFGLDSAGRLSDERYFLFYNQRRSPEGAMALSEGASGGTARFQVDLAALPDHIQRLSFTAAIDGGRTLRELEQGSIGLWVRGEEMARYAYAGNEFSGERAIVAGELYRKNGDWKFSAVGRGFNGGRPRAPCGQGEGGNPREEEVQAPEQQQREEQAEQEHEELFPPRLAFHHNCRGERGGDGAFRHFAFADDAIRIAGRAAGERRLRRGGERRGSHRIDAFLHRGGRKGHAPADQHGLRGGRFA